MKTKNKPAVSGADLVYFIESHLRNAGFHEEIIAEIVEALEWKLEFNKYKEEIGINTF